MKLTRTIKVGNLSSTPTIENEQVPSQEELSRIFRNSSSRIRLAEALIALSDLRPESIGNFDGTDGLVLADLPEVHIDAEKKEVTIDVIPTIVIVRAPISKGRHKYFSLLPEEGCSYLKESLEERLRAGESLSPTSPVVSHDRVARAGKSFMMTSKTDPPNKASNEKGWGLQEAVRA